MKVLYNHQNQQKAAINTSVEISAIFSWLVFWILVANRWTPFPQYSSKLKGIQSWHQSSL